MHGEQRHVPQQPQVRVRRRVDERGREHGVLERGFHDRSLGDRLGRIRRETAAGRGAERREEHEALARRRAPLPGPGARWRRRRVPRSSHRAGRGSPTRDARPCRRPAARGGRRGGRTGHPSRSGRGPGRRRAGVDRARGNARRRPMLVSRRNNGAPIVPVAPVSSSTGRRLAPERLRRMTPGPLCKRI